MNNTFSFNRFKNLLLKDGKMYVRNYGTSLIVWCSLNAIFWIFNLLFGSETNSIVRFGMLCIWMAGAMMMVPEKVFGKANLSREGVGFAMMPASSLEKFVSMFIYCAIVTPIVVFFGGFLVDTLLSLFPFGGFENPIHLYSLNEIYRMADSEGGMAQFGDTSIPFDTVLPIGIMRAQIILKVLQWSAIFMLGNMLFKKHKAGKTFACVLGISYVLSSLLALIFVKSEWFKNAMEGIETLNEMQFAQGFRMSMVWGVVIGIVITSVLLYFTYRKIKTQKY